MATAVEILKRLKLQRLLLLTWRLERPLHKQTSVEWLKRQEGTALGSKGNKNTCRLRFQLGVDCRTDLLL